MLVLQKLRLRISPLGGELRGYTLESILDGHHIDEKILLKLKGYPVDTDNVVYPFECLYRQ